MSANRVRNPSSPFRLFDAAVDVENRRVRKRHGSSLVFGPHAGAVVSSRRNGHTGGVVGTGCSCHGPSPEHLAAARFARVALCATSSHAGACRPHGRAPRELCVDDRRKRSARAVRLGTPLGAGLGGLRQAARAVRPRRAFVAPSHGQRGSAARPVGAGRDDPPRAFPRDHSGGQTAGIQRRARRRSGHCRSARPTRSHAARLAEGHAS